MQYSAKAKLDYRTSDVQMPNKYNVRTWKSNPLEYADREDGSMPSSRHSDDGLVLYRGIYTRRACLGVLKSRHLKTSRSKGDERKD